MQYTQRDFLHAVLAHSGLPCFAYKRPDSKGMQHQVVHTVDEACDYMEKKARTRDADYYFCISTLAAEKVMDRGSWRTRTQANASHTRCFILDIDIHADETDKEGKVKPNKFYATQDEGREALQNLIAALEMPLPIIVNSGYGLHVYWPMAEGVPSDEWKIVAERFKRVVSLIDPRLDGDGTRTADSASVLRVPGTFNLKNGKCVPVEIEQWSDEILDFGIFARQMQKHGGPTPSPQQPSLVPSVTLTLEREEMEPVSLRQLVRNCNWVARYLKAPEDAGEPAWYAMLGLAPYVTHVSGDTILTGVDIAQVFSRKHPQYDAADTERKFLQASFGQTGPTTCSRFMGIDREGCAGCPFAGDVRSPTSAARLSRPITEPKAVETTVHGEDGSISQAVVHIPVPPAPYFRGEDGGVFIRAKKQEEDGSWTSFIQKVYDYDLYPTRRYRTENVETEALEIQLHLPMDGMRTFKMPTEYLAEQKKLSSFLMGHGVIPEHGSGLILAKYMVNYVRDMQMTKVAETEFSRFGWRDIDTDKPKFVVGNGFIARDGKLNAGSFAHFLKQASFAVASAGNLAQWKKAFNVYKGIEGSEAFQIVSLLGFASPLLATTEYHGLLVNMVGHGGAGKSTALRIMSSVWGQPNDSHLRVTDNEIPMYNLLGYLNSIPVSFDELTKWDPDKLGKFVLNLTGGRGKMRATRTGANASNETEWDTIVACSSNTSLYNKLAEARTGYTAEAMRVYEINVPEGQPEHKHLFTEANNILLKNYGIAGRVFMETVIKNLPALQVAVEKTMAKLDRTGARRTDERFWVALFACLLVGGTIAKKLGLHDYDVDYLVEWAGGQANEARAEIATSHATPLAVLSDYFNDTLNGTLYFREGAVNLDSPTNFLHSVKNRLEYSGQQATIAWISLAALRTYCGPRAIDMAWLKRGLVDAGVLTEKEVTKRLATGTNLPNTPTRSWEINMAHPLLNDVVTIPEESK